jgi:hypothetical protein
MGKYDVYLTFDNPIPFEKNGKKLLFYPVPVRKIFYFSAVSDILLLEKNEDGSLSLEEKLKRISMSYLDFLFASATEENQYLPKLNVLIRLCLNKDEDESFKINMGFDKEGKAALVIGDVLCNGSDFETIREIIAEQNLIDLPDESIQKELRDKLEEAERFKSKALGGGTKPGTMEDLLICVLISAPFKDMNDVYNMSIRKFRKILERIDVKMHYQIFVSASMSGMVELKDKSVLAHWTRDLSKKRYSDVMVNPDAIAEKGGLTKK